MAITTTKVHIKNQQICCPICGSTIEVLGTVICANEPRAYAGECREQSCGVQVRFHIHTLNVSQPHQKGE